MHPAVSESQSPARTSRDCSPGRRLVALAVIGLCLSAPAGFFSPATAVTVGGTGQHSWAAATSPPAAFSGAPIPSHASTLQAAPTANLSVSPSPANPGETVTLDASGSNGSGGDTVVECEFDVDGDGSYDVRSQTCVHETSFAEVGTYEVTVRTTTESGNSSTASETLSVQEQADPIAIIDVDVDAPRVGDTVTMRGTASSDEDGSIVRYTWTVDGRTLRGETVSYEPTTAGELSITLQVTDDDGNENTTTRTVAVSENRPPSATLVVRPATPTAGEQVTLDASDSTDADGDALRFHWDLDGDGTTDRESEIPETTLSVGEAGPHTATVTVADDSGATDSAAVEYELAPASTPSPTPVVAATETQSDSAPANGTGDASDAAGLGFLDALDPGVVPFLPDWLALVLVVAAAGAAIAVRRRKAVRARLSEYRKRVRTGQFRRKVAKSASGFVAKSIAKRFLRRGADIIEYVSNGLGEAFERVGRAIKNVGQRVANFLRKLGA